jgi:hypothetical protein
VLSFEFRAVDWLGVRAVVFIAAARTHTAVTAFPGLKPHASLKHFRAVNTSATDTTDFVAAILAVQKPALVAYCVSYCLFAVGAVQGFSTLSNAIVELLGGGDGIAITPAIGAEST